MKDKAETFSESSELNSEGQMVKRPALSSFYKLWLNYLTFINNLFDMPQFPLRCSTKVSVETLRNNIRICKPIHSLNGHSLVSTGISSFLCFSSQEAYCQYLSCMIYISQVLKDDAWDKGVSYFIFIFSLPKGWYLRLECVRSQGSLGLGYNDYNEFWNRIPSL